jgi:hypothetical protein
MSAKRANGEWRSVRRAVTGGAGASHLQEAATAKTVGRSKPYRVSFVPDRELLERARNTAFALSGTPEVLTPTKLLNDALRREVERLERRHNRGRSFPARPGVLRPGRRPGWGPQERHLHAARPDCGPGQLKPVDSPRTSERLRGERLQEVGNHS